MMFKRIAIFAFAALLAFAMAGCASMSTEEIVAKAAKANSEIKNLEADISMDFVISSQGQDMAIGMTGSAIIHEDPLKMKMNMELSMPGLDAPMKTESYGVTEGGNLVNYTLAAIPGMGDGAQGQWFKQVLPVGDLGQLKQADAKANMELYLSSAQNFKIEGDETINGVSCTKLSGVLTGEAMKKAVMASSAVDSMAQVGMDDSIFSDLGDLPVVIWVDKQSFVPVRYSMDMTQPMDKMMKKIGESSGDSMAVKTCVIGMTYKNVNKAPDFVLPPETANAMELPGTQQ